MFQLKQNGLKPSVEIAAGASTFFSMVYVLAANPHIVAEAGLPIEALFTATALGVIVATLIMAFGANLPFAVAPGMGLNAFFVAVVVQMGYSWPQALTAVLFSGLVFVALSLSPARAKVLKEVPKSLQHGVCAGVGLMIAYIGLLHSQIVVFNHGQPSLGNLSSGPPLLACIGLLVMGALLAARFRYAILAGIVVTTLIGLRLGVTDASGLSAGLVSLPPSLSSIAFKFDFSPLVSLDFWALILTFAFMEIIDGLAGFLGLFGVMGQEGDRYRPRMGRAFIADSVGVVVGSCLGLSPNTTYAESGAGVAAGGRTGLTALTVAFFFGLALFVSPLFMVIPFSAVAPALVLVGLLMIRSILQVSFDDWSECFPAFATAIVITFTWRISDGLTLGWLLHLLMKVLSGQRRQITVTVWVVGAIFAANFISKFAQAAH
ncbi:MAG: NCS2 family permease [Deltaproteobacteria bacterium]|jgi:AGZA family xanthine/uracil permease-like MFS transporter|nr:NCS2 family permease [Deltaproteobacteria bacterium]